MLQNVKLVVKQITSAQFNYTEYEYCRSQVKKPFVLVTALETTSAMASQIGKDTKNGGDNHVMSMSEEAHAANVRIGRLPRCCSIDCCFHLHTRVGRTSRLA